MRKDYRSEMAHLKVMAKHNVQGKFPFGRDEKSSLQSTKKNAVVDVDHQCRPVENSSLHFSTG